MSSIFTKLDDWIESPGDNGIKSVSRLLLVLLLSVVFAFCVLRFLPLPFTFSLLGITIIGWIIWTIRD